MCPPAPCVPLSFLFVLNELPCVLFFLLGSAGHVFLGLLAAFVSVVEQEESATLLELTLLASTL